MKKICLALCVLALLFALGGFAMTQANAGLPEGVVAVSQDEAREVMGGYCARYGYSIIYLNCGNPCPVMGVCPSKPILYYNPFTSMKDVSFNLYCIECGNNCGTYDYIVDGCGY
jgi:hypothetical protein